MKHAWIFALAGALAATRVLAAPVSPPLPRDNSQLSIYEGIRQVAVTSCTNPPLAGWTITAKGSGEVSLKPATLAKLLAALNIKLAGGVEYGRWSGMLQRDAAAAFANRNDCVTKLFEVMVKGLPVTDQTGSLLPKPAHPDVIYKTLVAQSTTTTTDQPQSVIGNTSAGPQANNTGSGTSVAVTGNATTFVFPPPVTTDEKLRAHDALIEELRQLASYPERDELGPPPTIMQEYFAQKVPRALYIRLSKYYDSTIITVPNGDKLISYEKDYYTATNNARNFERNAIAAIGLYIQDQHEYVWRTYFKYCFTRALGFDAATIKAGNGQISFGSYDEAEKACTALQQDQSTATALHQLAQAVSLITNTANYLLSQYR